MFWDFLCDIRPIIQILFLKYCVVFGEAKDKGKKNFQGRKWLACMLQSSVYPDWLSFLLELISFKLKP